MGDCNSDSSANRNELTLEVRTTCDVCLRKKIKCDKGRPSCWHCAKRGLPCKYSLKKKPGRKRCRALADNKNGDSPTAEEHYPGDEKAGDSEREIPTGSPKSSGKQAILQKKQAGQLIQSERASSRKPQYLSFLVGSLGHQEACFLDVFLNVFKSNIPALTDSGFFSRVLAQQPLASGDVPLTSCQQANNVVVWSSIAIGSILSCNQRDLPTYLGRMRAAVDGGGLLSHSTEGVRARMQKALLNDLLGNDARTLYLMDDSSHEIENGVKDTKCSSSLKILSVFLSGKSQKSYKKIMAMAEEGVSTFFDGEEGFHVPQCLRQFYEAGLALAKMPFLFGHAELSEETVRACHHNLVLVEAEVVRAGDSAFTLLVVQDCLTFLEICLLGMVQEGLNRAVGMLRLLQGLPSLSLISYINMAIHRLAFIFRYTGNQDSYGELAALHNSMIHLKVGDEKPLPPFSEYCAETQCDHFRCRNMFPKFKLALDMFFNPPAALPTPQVTPCSNELQAMPVKFEWLAEHVNKHIGKQADKASPTKSLWLDEDVDNLASEPKGSTHYSSSCCPGDSPDCCTFEETLGSGIAYYPHSGGQNVLLDDAPAQEIFTAHDHKYQNSKLGSSMFHMGSENAARHHIRVEGQPKPFSGNHSPPALASSQAEVFRHQLPCDPQAKNNNNDLIPNHLDSRSAFLPETHGIELGFVPGLVDEDVDFEEDVFGADQGVIS